MPIPANFDPKTEVRAVLSALKTANPAAKLGDAYEMMSAAYGFRSWNAMSAFLKAAPIPSAPESETKTNFSFQSKLYRLKRDLRGHLLIIGDTGCGKSVLANALAKELGKATHSKPLFVTGKPVVHKLVWDMWRNGKCDIKTYHLLDSAAQEFHYLSKLHDAIVVLDEMQIIVRQSGLTLESFLDQLTTRGCLVIGCLDRLDPTPLPHVDLYLMHNNWLHAEDLLKAYGVTLSELGGAKTE